MKQVSLLIFFLLTAISYAQPLPPPELRADDGTVIEVMVLYTQNARAIAGGSGAQTVEMIDAAITDVNQAFAAAGVMTELDVVAYQPVFYLEQVNEDFHADLNNVTGTSDGYLDEIHALRDYYAADLVLLVTGTWFYIYTGDSDLMTIPDAGQGFAVWEARGLVENSGAAHARWIARLLGVDSAPPFDVAQAATLNANRGAVANYRDSASRVIAPVILTQNGGFETDMDEDGVPDFWAKAGWAAGDKRLCSKPGKVRSGACSIKFKLGAGANMLIQPIDASGINLQDELLLTGYAMSSHSANCVKAILISSFETMAASRTVEKTCLPASGVWTPFSVQATVMDTVTALKLKLKTSGTGRLWLDDIMLEAVPMAARGGRR
jgi:hypothetical protein